MLVALVVVGAQTFAILPGEAQVRLNEFSTQSGLQMLFDYAVMQGVPTHGVEGTLDPFVALQRMIEGTPIRYQFINGRTVTLTLAPTPIITLPESLPVSGYLYAQAGWYYSCVPLTPFGTIGYSWDEWRQLKIAIGLGRVPPDQLYCVPDAPINPDAPPLGYLPPPNEIAVTVTAKRKPNKKPFTFFRRNK
jgi:hypothetical protein